MKRESTHRFSAHQLANLIQAQANAGITEDLDLWPELQRKLERQRRAEPVWMTTGAFVGEYERWMEEALEPNQVWIWITCYVHHEQAAADALREAFTAAGIPEQLLDIVVPPSLGKQEQTAHAGIGEVADIDQALNWKFTSLFMAKVAQTEAVAAVLRGGPFDAPMAGWSFNRIARRAQDRPENREPGELAFKPMDWVRVLTWPFEGFTGQVVHFDQKKSQILVRILGHMPPIYLNAGEIVKKVEDPKRAWYVLYGYPGHEEKLRNNLRQRLVEARLHDHLFDIILPFQGQDSISVIKDGKVHPVYPALFPGAVFVLLSLSSEVWEVVRQTPGLTGFVGSGNTPLGYLPGSTPNLTGQTQQSGAGTAEAPVQLGDQVRILSGPFYDFRGTVIAVDAQRSKLRVMIDFYKRPTPVEVGYDQVEKV